MTGKENKRISKKLSYTLRHNPSHLDVELDDQGWTVVAGLLKGLKAHGWPLKMAELEEVAETNSKQRFEFNEKKTKIRARQGHSLEVDLGWEVATPPEFLFHGTPTRSVDTIMREGLKKMNRHHVHLSPDQETAAIVGSRRGKHTILRVSAAEMAKGGASFMKTANDVWLVDAVPSDFIQPDYT